MKAEKIEAQKQRLAQKKEKLAREERRLALQSRKARTAKLIRLGGLFEDAGLFDLDPKALLGLLLESYEASKDPSVVSRWLDLGSRRLQSKESEDNVALIVQLDIDPPKKAVDLLKSMNFRWNKFRQEWQGYGSKEKLLDLLSEAKPEIQVVEVP